MGGGRVGVHVHHPVHVRGTTQEGDGASGDAEVRRRGEGHDDVGPGGEEAGRERAREVQGVVGQTSCSHSASPPDRGQPGDCGLVRAPGHGAAFVGPAGADHAHVVAARGQGLGEILEEPAGWCEVGRMELIEEEQPQGP